VLQAPGGLIPTKVLNNNTTARGKDMRPRGPRTFRAATDPKNSLALEETCGWEKAAPMRQRKLCSQGRGFFCVLIKRTGYGKRFLELKKKDLTLKIFRTIAWSVLLFGKGKRSKANHNLLGDPFLTGEWTQDPNWHKKFYGLRRKQGDRAIGSAGGSWPVFYRVLPQGPAANLSPDRFKRFPDTSTSSAGIRTMGTRPKRAGRAYRRALF